MNLASATKQLGASVWFRAMSESPEMALSAGEILAALAFAGEVRMRCSHPGHCRSCSECWLTEQTKAARHSPWKE